MARSRRQAGGSVFNRTGNRPASTTTAAAPSRPAVPAPAPAAPTPAPMQQSSSGGGMMAGLASTVAQGMAFGTGSAIAHRAVGAVANSFGGGSSDTPTVDQQPQQSMQSQLNNGGVCQLEKQNMYECMQQNKNDQEACTFLYQMLKDCQQNQLMYNN